MPLLKKKKLLQKRWTLKFLFLQQRAEASRHNRQGTFKQRHRRKKKIPSEKQVFVFVLILSSFTVKHLFQNSESARGNHQIWLIYFLYAFFSLVILLSGIVSLSKPIPTFLVRSVSAIIPRISSISHMLYNALKKGLHKRMPSVKATVRDGKST